MFYATVILKNKLFLIEECCFNTESVKMLYSNSVFHFL